MPHRDKREVAGVVVKLLHHKRDDRGMTLIEHESRCVRRGDIHELVTTDQAGAVSGDRIDRVGFLGFIEIESAGVVERGDAVIHKGTVLGSVLGFDECHVPNHYNILVAAPRLCTAGEIGLEVEDAVTFQNPTKKEE
jgi:hypothetical protein